MVIPRSVFLTQQLYVVHLLPHYYSHYLNTSFYFEIEAVPLRQGVTGTMFSFHSASSLMMSATIHFLLLILSYVILTMWYSTGLWCIICTHLKTKGQCGKHTLKKKSQIVKCKMQGNIVLNTNVSSYLSTCLFMYSKGNKL